MLRGPYAKRLIVVAALLAVVGLQFLTPRFGRLYSLLAPLDGLKQHRSMHQDGAKNSSHREKLSVTGENLLKQRNGMAPTTFMPISPVNVTSHAPARVTTSLFSVGQHVCSSALPNNRSPQFDTNKLMQNLTQLFTDGGNGVWSPAFEQEYQKILSRNLLPVKVILLPFSHADPGWLLTVKQYFERRTGPTLNNMLEHLEQKPHMKFIWSEMSFFSMWWSTISREQQLRVRALVDRKQLEFVNGGFVMPDEATAHLFAIVHQYVTGHQFLQNNLNTTVRHGWSIDQFGYSATLPYLLTQLGIQTNYIQRVHYNLRQYLAQNKGLRFIWQQRWKATDDDKNALADGLMTYLSPTHLYSIRNSCGPHWWVCQQFDFRTSFWQWLTSSAARAKSITPESIKEKATALAAEYSRMASLSDHKVYLHLLGDDFRYANSREWNQQYENYELLRNYINKESSFNMTVEWGTLDTYYAAIAQNYAQLSKLGQTTNNVPTLQGDFHPYADKYAEYWSGYYTTRPVLKRMSRELEWRLRNAEIIASFVGLRTPHSPSQMLDPEDEWRLNIAAEALGLFQHHDAITGTSKPKVVADYAVRLLAGLRAAGAVIKSCISRLLLNSSRVDVSPPKLVLRDDRPDNVDLPPAKLLIDLTNDEERTILIYNSLARHRVALVKFRCNTPNIVVLDADDECMNFQVNPVWIDLDTASSDEFEIILFAKVMSLSVTPFEIRRLSAQIDTIPEKIMPHMSSISTNSKLMPSSSYFIHKPFPTAADLYNNSILIENELIALYFNFRTGMLQSYNLKTSSPLNSLRKARLSFLTYSTTDSDAYVFIPLGAASMLLANDTSPRSIRIQRGPLSSQIDVILTDKIMHSVRIYHTTTNISSIHSVYVDVENTFDISDMSSKELIMRISTDIDDNDWYTDANGFQMMPRRTSPQLPIQAHYYPITTQAYLESTPDSASAVGNDTKKRRMTLHVNEAHGAASLRPGELEVMLDRRLYKEDTHGMGEPLTDSRKTQQNMRIVFENIPFESDADRNSTISNPTLVGHLINQDLNSPVEILLLPSGKELSGLIPIASATAVLPCDTNLLMFRPLTKRQNPDASVVSSVGLMLHRYGVQCRHTNDSVDLLVDECDNSLYAADVDLAYFMPTDRKQSFSVFPSAINFVTPEESPEMFANGKIKLASLKLNVITIVDGSMLEAFWA